MKIYRIFNPNRIYKTISYSNTPILDNIGKNVWDNLIEVSSFHYKWENTEEVKDICACPFIIGSIPVFDDLSFRKLENKLAKGDVQIIPISVDGRPFFIINAIRLVEDLLNKQKSEVSFFSDGRIMDIDKYVFYKKNNIPDMFKISQLQTYTFVNEKIAFALESCCIKGLSIEECKTTLSLFHF